MNKDSKGITHSSDDFNSAYNMGRFSQIRIDRTSSSQIQLLFSNRILWIWVKYQKIWRQEKLDKHRWQSQ
ncbi:unnamed protein product [Paramecium octaurelia]|uniref:Uncharacterized protein n=1 Tax=Paramecium octaurelia TaxID=43137 RepID=A0A8S1YKS8_PAROT|nr:unnamed protein product [Paramecium octaurelia]